MLSLVRASVRQLVVSPRLSSSYSILAMASPAPQQPYSGGPRRNRNRRGRGKGATPNAPGAAGLASASAPSILERAASPVAQVIQTRAFSTTQSILAGYQSTRKFADTNLMPRIKANIPPTWEFMSEIQAQTVDVCLTGKDLLAQAKTGTGKTVAFLLPTIQRLLQNPVPGGGVGAIIITPTRELAIQIRNECMPLIHGTTLKVVPLVGGVNVNKDLKLLSAGCDIIVATPGRLKDHLENLGMRPRVAALKTLILDEADRLLDMGFAPDIRRIVAFLPNRATVPRQSMLFSATVPPAVMDVKNIVLLPDHAHVSTIDPKEANAHMHVDQHFLTAPLDQHASVFLELIRNDIKKHGAHSKVMAFYPIARGAQLAAHVLKGLTSPHLNAGRQPAQPDFPVFEQHSRLSQATRLRTTDAFGKSPNGVMVTSDVTARGMDFPNVTLVVQMTAPSNEEDYVHRLGRTARAGTDGYGILGMKAMPLAQHPETEGILNRAKALTPAVHDATRAVEEDVRSKAYSATLGQLMQTRKIHRMNEEELVRAANQWVYDALLWPHDEPPPISTMTAGKMGLRKTPGLNLFVEQRAPRGAPKAKA
ncbi:DEAD-domain-containing protein [Auriculariales sp. MPI-PUGE-AT-0066]|nr:DEAD-domain-containing protein [Auriculariales sp. MPI-PUGE-AT-0066]